jgi:adenosylmethionine-8-amino-7-oxononanoate aminotransferase
MLLVDGRVVVGAAAGNIAPVPGYFPAIRRVCDKYGVLLVLDEIMCGMGRTGKMHAWEWEGTSPGFLTLDIID